MTQPRDTADVIGSRGTAATVDTGTAAGQVPLNSDLGSASLVDTGLLTGNVPTADDLSMVGETVNYTGANYQPEDFEGVNVVKLCRNITGSTIVSGATTGASTLRNAVANSSGVMGGGALLGGDWENVANTDIMANAFGLFRRYQ